MFSLFAKRPTEERGQVQAEVPPEQPALKEAVASIAKQATSLGQEAAEVCGLIEDTAKGSSRSAKVLAELETQVQEVTRAQDGIGSTSQSAIQAVERARKAVEGIGNEVSAIVSTLKEVSGAASSITQIALQTRLVAFNASVEAKRAGEAGRGFGVVADAVKDLAGKVEVSSKDIMSTIGVLGARIEALAKEIQKTDGAEEQGAFHQALADVNGGVGSICSAAEQSRGICAGLNQQMAAIESEMHQTSQMLETSLQRSQHFLQVSEHLCEWVANCGIETDDTPYIRAVTEAAAEVSALLENALRNGDITRSDLFDEAYQSLPGTNPPQHTTRFVGLADRLFPQVQERMLELSSKVVFCIAVDRNGYVAAHNKKYCHPQRGDLAWDTANSRYRRIFNDRTGLAAARNERPFLLQTYRRDMGGGNYILLKEADAPITVDGRHWGGLRLAFQF
jgi:methyl-accepting chemotaxis protein